MPKLQSFESMLLPDDMDDHAAADGEQTTRSRRAPILTRDEQGLVATRTPVERAVLVGVEISSEPGLLTLEDSLSELALLTDTAGLQVVGQLTQRLDKRTPATLIGSGKLQELATMVAEVNANVVIFDDELSPRQQRELEKELGEETKVIDRTALILDIFARHARTREGAVQVELAQYEYRLPRLTRAWTHLARQAGGRAGGASGGVGVRGPGETQLEVDRREIDRRIAFLKRQLIEISKYRNQYRQNRRQSSASIIALVGYTNAGKSTLLNALSHANVVAMDRLFATLDPTTRRVELTNGHTALLTDTVGFIQKLPTMLVAAFRATLEEVTEADVLIHVVDLSHPNMDEQVAAVEEVLEELGAGDKLVVTALNKADRVEQDDAEVAARIQTALKEYPNAVVISALTGQGLEDLRAKIEGVLRNQMAPIDVLIPYAHGELVALAHEHGAVESEEHTETGTHLVGRMPVALAGRYANYWNQE
ncbi:MAG: GTPase HflX [Chloroflexota bacterium]|nr:GTPase HflX [Chloroflexota bacterium]